MKRISIITLSVMLVAVLIFGALPAIAAKPPENGAGKNVIELSNGFPSGFHFNLNIHGKNPLTFTCPTDSGGNSIFIPEYTADYPDDDIQIEMVSNKKASVYELTVLDACAMPESEGGDNLARVQLPYKIQPDELGPVIDANGYYVYARILGKPDNSKDPEDGPSNIILTPSPVLRGLNDLGDPAFPDYTDINDSLLVLGLVTSNGAYKATYAGFERFDTDTGGKGKSKAQNITDLFMWTGWACDASLDINEDGVIDENDVPIDQDGDGDIDADDLQLWLEAKATEGLARYYEDWWVFDIADLVVQTWDVDNDGTKLIQIRFYPVATTEFTEMAHIVVKKVTDPASDRTTLFDFTCDYRNDFQMTNNQFCLSGELAADTYHVSEVVPDGWDLTGIQIEDPTGDSTHDFGTGGTTATIELAKGETVIVTYTNTQLGSITVQKETVGGDSSFDFDPSWSEVNFSLNNGGSEASGWLVAGTYTVSELAASIGWDLTAITITGDDDYTAGDIGTRTATIELDPGENVTVAFTNTYVP